MTAHALRYDARVGSVLPFRSAVPHPAPEAVRTRLVQRIGALGDPRLHAGVAARELLAAGPAAAVWALAALYRAQPRGVELAAWLAVTRTLAARSSVPGGFLEAMRHEARREGHVVLDVALGDTPPRRTAAPGGDLDPDAPEDTWPLGQRRWKARLHDARELARLRLDSDPGVIAALLDNPRTTERDAVLIAARRPVPVNVLVALASHPRWPARYGVRLAIASNPWAPPRLAALCLPTLRRPDVEAVARRGSLHGEVRRAAQHVLSLRTGPPPMLED